jgi:chromosome segregation ATPase
MRPLAFVVTCIAATVLLSGAACLAADPPAKSGVPAPSQTPGKPGPGPKIEKKVVPKDEEYYQMMEVHLRNMSDHARMLYHHAATRTSAVLNREVIKEHVNDIGASLEATKKYIARVEAGMTQAEMTESKAAFDELHASIAKAEESFKALRTEVEAAEPKLMAIRTHAAGVHHEAEKAVTGEKAIMAKRGIVEPPPPVYPQPQE